MSTDVDKKRAVFGLVLGLGMTLAGYLTASAACAWVVWEKDEALYRAKGSLSNQPSWRIEQAFPTSAECATRAKVYFDAYYELLKKLDPQHLVVDRVALSLTVRTGSGDDETVTRHTMVCLPDTVDPRK